MKILERGGIPTKSPNFGLFLRIFESIWHVPSYRGAMHSVLADEAAGGRA